jgi:cystathionine beta-lyase/cystathionine gamma-synthase
VSSTISVPVKMSHASTPLALRALRGIPSDLVRISTGIEDAEELIDDLDRALNTV